MFAARLYLFGLTAVHLVHASLKVVPMTFARGMAEVESAIEKRAGDFPVTLGNPTTPHLYYVNVSVGTPAQVVKLQLDTGSSDMWMFGPPPACNLSTSDCLGGTYDVSQSSTAQQLSNYPEFQIQYVTPNSGVQGFYFQDTVSLGSVSLTSMTMAEATYAAYVPTGIMGIGYDTNEAYYQSSNGGGIYPNIVDEMLNQGLINRRAYSLYLDDREAATGTILFGGYDTDKYTGALTPLQIQPSAQSGNITSFTVVLSAMGVTTSSGTQQITSSFPLPVVLDSGTSFTTLPQDIFNTLATAFNVVSEYDGELYLVDCSYANEQITIDFEFGGNGGPIIQVPISEIVLPLINSTSGDQIVIQGQPICQFGATPTYENSDNLFGDTFLRSAYVVYDLDGEICYIAQSNVDSTTSNIQEIPADGVGNPVSVSSATYSTQSASATGDASLASSAMTATSSLTSIPTFSASSSGGLNLGGGVSSSGGLVITSTAENPATTAAAATTSTPPSSAGVPGKIYVSRQFGWVEIMLFLVPALGVGLGAFL